MPTSQLILKRPESRFPGSLIPTQEWSRSLSKGRAKLWFRVYLNVPRVSSHYISLPVSKDNLLLPLHCSLSPQPTASAFQPSASPSPHLHSTCTFLPFGNAPAAKPRAWSHLSTYPRSSDLFRSASSGVPEPGITVQPPYRTLLPKHAKSPLGQLGASRLLGGWADEHSKRGGVL